MTWTLYISVLGADYIQFMNAGIQYQMPLLLVVVVMKYLILFLKRYRTSHTLFYMNLVGYILFLVAVIVIDYYEEFFG